MLFLVYMAVIQPLLFLCVPPITHCGTELYTEGQYLKYDNSDVFTSALSTFPIPVDAEVTAFYYYDSRWRDNMFYGNMCDVFVLDLSLGQHYQTAQDYVLQNSEYCYSEGGRDMHWLQNAVSVDNACFLVVVCNQEKMIRCILLTDYDNNAGMVLGVDTALFQNFGIDWTEDVLPQYN